MAVAQSRRRDAPPARLLARHAKTSPLQSEIVYYRQFVWNSVEKLTLCYEIGMVSQEWMKMKAKRIDPDAIDMDF